MNRGIAKAKAAEKAALAAREAEKGGVFRLLLWGRIIQETFVVLGLCSASGRAEPGTVRGFMYEGEQALTDERC